MKCHSILLILGILSAGLVASCRDGKVVQDPHKVVLSVAGHQPEVSVTYFVIRPDGSKSKRYEVVSISNTVAAIDSIGARRTTRLTVGFLTGENAANISIVTNGLASAGFSNLTVEPYKGK